MTKEMQIAILMTDGMTKDDAKRCIKDGSTIYDSIDDWIETLKANDVYEGETPEKVRAGEYGDVFAAEYNGHEYCVEIVR